MVGALRILLVDDNLDHVQLATRALRVEASWRVDTARLGDEALERANEERYDLVLLDYRLPDMSGLDVLRTLRAKGKEPAVILMTSQGSEEVAIQALQLGAAAYVVKNNEFGKRLVYEVKEWLLSKEDGA
ncbi:MAG TPA: response regulator [Candidatus Thermoplasmatota archaeon]|nr:response regulator [Candidatus Thermoplasmatota archaeon]